MKDRIRKIMETLQISQQEFAQQLEISPASLSSIFTGRTNPTNNHVQAVHRAFPDISVNWLLFGEGNMYENTSLMASGNDNDSVANTNAYVPLTEEKTEGVQASLFETMGAGTLVSPPQGGYNSVRNASVDSVKIIDKKKRSIKEIRVFFDDGTYESFVPGK